jgi:hypothetical protein
MVPLFGNGSPFKDSKISPACNNEVGSMRWETLQKPLLLSITAPRGPGGREMEWETIPRGFAAGATTGSVVGATAPAPAVVGIAAGVLISGDGSMTRR